MQNWRRETVEGCSGWSELKISDPERVLGGKFRKWNASGFGVASFREPIPFPLARTYLSLWMSKPLYLISR